MEILRPIDLATWPRREHFEHYRDRVPCTYAMTVDVDVTALRMALSGTAVKSSVAVTWALSTIVNRHQEFRMALHPTGAPAVWDVVHPAFTVFNPERETFAGVWTPHRDDFATFHGEAVEVIERHRTATSLFPQSDTPANTFDVSSIPWASFTGFTLDIGGGFDHLLPIITLGRYRQTTGRTVMPVAIQVHHAAADGFHTARLVNELQVLLASPEWTQAAAR
ncbi:chloramphenicol acetyltransferase CAT [Curtobacterium sp. MCPF17_011]|uniref:CatA-like O-acetyltransferase n=1 Tax=unclassified Curtobacterium TaxID=257496 RepID=UPI000D96EE04|nr:MULTISPECIES: CatA-like O-acetyltransferase [unclassified Curtobacterium]PYY33439.1 chloramphenicol acetyltransferase CAT [Curtobacterium sp. MCBD17_030]PZF08589.1 chloramphenicol acetyltransferase CAT [Curtobacterium sp. MCPF17_011]